MINGDRLSGEVLLMDSGTLVLKTDYAGEIRINWNKVAQLQTDDRMLLRAKGLPNGYEARLAPAGPPGRSAGLQHDDAIEEEGSHQVALADIERLVRPHAFLRDWSFEGGIDVAMNATYSSKSNQNWSGVQHATARRDWWRHGVKLNYTRKAQDGVVGTYNYDAAYMADRFLSEKSSCAVVCVTATTVSQTPRTSSSWPSDRAISSGMMGWVRFRSRPS